MYSKKKFAILALLILIPAFVNLGVPIYNRESPELFGLPFFYWFQTFWLFGAAGFYFVFSKIKENES